MAGLGGGPGAGMTPAGSAPMAYGPLSAVACRQYAALAAMRWQMFTNNLRSSMGVVELGARALSYVVYGSLGVGMSVGLGFGSYFIVSRGKTEYLPILFWAVFVVWQMLPVALASFQEQFDLGILLRFPLGFVSYVLLYLLFGLVDVSSIAGGMCCLGLMAGITTARPDLTLVTLLALLVFAGFNILLVRSIFAWIDRWLAQRRTREIIGAIFVLLLLSLQLFNPALYQTQRRTNMSRVEREAEGERIAEEARPWMTRAVAVQRWLPPGLASQGVSMAVAGETEMALDSLGLLLMYGLAAGVVLAVRLNSEYAGENLGEAPGRGQAKARGKGEWTPVRSGPIAAVIEKELRALFRTLPLLYGLGAPLLLVLVFSGVFVRGGAAAQHFTLGLPVCLIYVQLGFIQIFYNLLGAEGAGIQLYFLSPTPLRTVMLAKNLFYAMLYCAISLVGGVVACLRMGTPDLPVVVASAAWLLFALPCNLAVGNVFSLTMAYRINPGRLTKQKGSQTNNLLAVLVQFGILAVSAAVFSIGWLSGEPWLAPPVFLVLAAVAAQFWRMTLNNADAQANRHKDELIEKLVKTA